MARDRELLGILAELPLAKQQPNLLLGAVKLLFGVAPDWPQFRACVFSGLEEVLELIGTRRTQTNEPARCATLLPLLATLPAPLALLEVGASAGLCLLPDRYGYDYGRLRMTARRRSRAAPMPPPAAGPPSRGGVAGGARSLAGRHPRSRPGRVARGARLAGRGRASRDAARRARGSQRRPAASGPGQPPHRPAALAAGAPRDATLVVFHTAVLAYVADAGERAAFAATVRDLGAVWVANENPGLLTEDAPATTEPWPSGRFLLPHDGEPVAWTDPHAAAIDWLS